MAEHLEFLIKFLQIHYKSLNYDAQQLHSLLSTFVKIEASNANNAIINRWREDIEVGSILRIEQLHVNRIDEDENAEVGNNEKNEDDDDSEVFETNKNGHDFLANTNKDERFVISLSTDREEICVWNVIT